MSGDDKSLGAAREALKKAQRKTTGENGAPKSANKKMSMHRAAAGVLAFWEKAASACDVAWNGWLKPVTRFLSPITKRIIGFYRWSFATFSYTGPNAERVFSRNRAGITILALAVITFLTPIILVRQVVPAVSHTIYDAGMLATLKQDRLFLGRAELINPDRDLFQVMGCRDITGCDGGDNTTYYRLRPNVILGVKYWTTRFEPYDPAEIAGAMVSELNDCTIHYYGRRVKALGWYPYIVSASCVPV